MLFAVPDKQHKPPQIRAPRTTQRRRHMDFDLVIKNARIVTPVGVDSGEIGIKDGRIAAVAGRGSQLAAPSVVDAEQKYVIPGVVDPHVHVGAFNPLKDDFRTESQAAAAGGGPTIGIHFNVEEKDTAAEETIKAIEHCKSHFETNSVVDGFIQMQITERA